MVSLGEVAEYYLGILPKLDECVFYQHLTLDPGEREEAVAEARAWAWKWCLSAAEKGMLEQLNPYSIGRFASRMFRVGRRFAGCRISDAISPKARANRRVRILSIDSSNAVVEALTDSIRPSPFDVARISIDYDHALDDPDLPARATECFEHLLTDSETGHVKRIANEMGISSPRVCQIKKALAGALERIGYGKDAI